VVAEALGGVVPGAGYLTGTGGEKLPEGLDPLSIIVERSVPAAAMADALLAWEMNGVPISLAHGGPLRLIVPGYTGVNNIKYIKRLAFTAKETEAKIMSHGYRISPPGGKGEPSQPSVQEMTVKSWINSPAPDAAGVRAGLVQVQGVAFGGLNGIKRVEVSLDGGKTWNDARLTGPDLGRYAWRQFVLPARLPAGSHTLTPTLSGYTFSPATWAATVTSAIRRHIRGAWFTGPPDVEEGDYLDEFVKNAAR